MPQRFRHLARFALIVTSVIAFTIGQSASPASATTVLKGKVEVVSNPGPRMTLRLRGDFGPMIASGTFVFTVQVRDRNGSLVSQWQNTATVLKNEYVVRGYDWQTKLIPDGKYTFAMGISSGSVVQSWLEPAGSVVLGARGWSFKSSAVVASSQVAIQARFIAPSAALGRYALRTIVKDARGIVVDQFTDAAWLNGGQTFDVAKSIPAVTGSYTVDQEVWTEGLEIRIGSATRTSSFSVVVTGPTSTLAPATTSTTQPVTTTAPSTTTTTTRPLATTTTTAPAYNSTWILTGSDDFNGTTLDTSKYYLYSGIGNAGIGFRDPSNIRVGNGEVTLVGTTSNLTGAGICWCFPGSGQIYGRWEIRARMDKGNGFGPAILLWPDSENWPTDGELDITEMPNGDRVKSYTTTHWGANNSQDGTSQTGDFSQWHVFGVDWQADHVTYYLDGRPIWTHTDPVTIPRTPMHLAMQNDAGFGNSWISAVDANSPAEVNLHIDWIKIYK